MRITFPSRDDMMFLVPGTAYRLGGSPRRYRLVALYWDELAAEFDEFTAPATKAGLAAVDACLGEEP